jgi:hypothetical protein
VISRQREQIGGVILLLLGLGMTYLVWGTVVDKGTLLVRAAALWPAVAFIGLALLAVPGYRTERTARGEDISQLTGTALITPRWWGILVIALPVGVVNLYLLGVFGR